MTLDEAILFFKGEYKQQNTKSEIRVIKRFLGILTDIKSKDLAANDLEMLEQKLALLELEKPVENRRKHFNKAFNKLTTFLKSQFSFTMEGYYMGTLMAIGLALGTSMGVSFGTVFAGGKGVAIGMSIGTSIGMVIGMAIGNMKDAQAKKNGKALSVTYSETA